MNVVRISITSLICLQLLLKQESWPLCEMGSTYCPALAAAGPRAVLISFCAHKSQLLRSPGACSALGR